MTADHWSSLQALARRVSVTRSAMALSLSTSSKKSSDQWTGSEIRRSALVASSSRASMYRFQRDLFPSRLSSIIRKARRTCHPNDNVGVDGDRHTDSGTRRNTSPSARSSTALSPLSPVVAERYISTLGHLIPTSLAQDRKAWVVVAVGSSTGFVGMWLLTRQDGEAVVVVAVVVRSARRGMSRRCCWCQETTFRLLTQPSSPNEAREMRRMNVKMVRHQDEEDCLVAPTPLLPLFTGGSTSVVEVFSVDVAPSSAPANM